MSVDPNVMDHIHALGQLTGRVADGKEQPVSTKIPASADVSGSVDASGLPLRAFAVRSDDIALDRITSRSKGRGCGTV
eukprot:307660-Pyramimonas_sp.AAC.1